MLSGTQRQTAGVQNRWIEVCSGDWCLVNGRLDRCWPTNVVGLTNPAFVFNSLSATKRKIGCRKGIPRRDAAVVGCENDNRIVRQFELVEFCQQSADPFVEIHPEDAGLPVHPFKDILGGTPQENAEAFKALLDGAEGAYRDAVLLNSAAALVIAEKAADLKEGVAIAAESIASGAAKAKVEGLARITSDG